jgi:hypothetical protein
MTTWIQTYAEQLEACVLDRLGKRCTWGIVAGADVALDGCQCDDQCGQWWVAVTGIYPFTTFPNPDPAATCAAAIGASIQVGAVRCLAVPEGGDPLPRADHLAAFGSQMDDAFDLHAAIACCVKGYDVAVGVWTPIGPEGGCVGGYWTLEVAEA